MDAREITDLLTSYRFNYRDEVQLHEGLEQLLTEAGCVVRREVRLAAGRGRIDLVVTRAPDDWSVGIEVKVKGPASQVARQLARYAAAPELDQVLLVTTRRAHRSIDVDGVTVCAL